MTVFDWLDVEFTEALAQALIHSLWQGVLIISLLIIGEQMGFARSAERKYLFYMSGLILLFVSTIVSFFVAINWSHEGQIDTILTPFNSLISQHNGNGTASSTSFYWQGALVLAWFGGFMYSGFKNVIGTIRIFQLRKTAENAPLHWQRRVREMSRLMHIKARTLLLSTTETTVPFVMGVLRPVIIFPASYFVQLTPEQIEVILKHELAHIGRNDYLLNIVQIIIESLLFYNPATWWLSKQIRRHREFCCDDRVQADMPDQKTYLEALYNVARISTNHPASAVALFENKSELIMRMKRMSSKNNQQRSLRSLVMASIGLLTVFGLFAFNTIDSRNDNSGHEAFDQEPMMLASSDIILDLKLDHAIDLDMLDMELNKIDIVGRRQQGQIAGIQSIAIITSEIVSSITRETASRPIQELSKDLAQLAATNSLLTVTPALAIDATSSLIQHFVADTHPPTARMLELEAEMEELSEEMEELAEQMEEVIENTVETEVEKMEELAEEMELIAEQYESDFEDSPEMQRLDELSELLDEKMEALEEGLEEMEEGALEEIEELLESKSEEYEDYESLTEEEREKLTAEMKSLSAELQAASREMNAQYRELMEDPEIKSLQKEMEELSRELSQAHGDMQPMNEEMKRLQVEMQAQQQVIQEKMQGAVLELQNALQLKAREMQLLQIELHDEMQNWEDSKGKKDK